MSVSGYNRAVRFGKIAVVLSLVNLVFILCFLLGVWNAFIAYSFFLTIVVVLLSGISVWNARTGVGLAILIIHILIFIAYSIIIYLFRDFCVIC